MSALKNLGNGKQAYRVDIGENIVVDNVNLTNTPETPLYVTGGVQLTGSYVAEEIIANGLIVGAGAEVQVGGDLNTDCSSVSIGVQTPNGQSTLSAYLYPLVFGSYGSHATDKGRVELLKEAVTGNLRASSDVFKPKMSKSRIRILNLSAESVTYNVVLARHYESRGV